MPHSASAKKRFRQDVVRRLRNRAVRSTLRTHIRKVREAIATGDAQASAAELRVASKKLDQAASKRVIHPNTAARTKSRLSAAIKALGA